MFFRVFILAHYIFQKLIARKLDTVLMSYILNRPSLFQNIWYIHGWCVSSIQENKIKYKKVDLKGKANRFNTI